MRQEQPPRRTFLKNISGLTTASLVGIPVGGTLQKVPWSDGEQPPKIKAPAHAIDCHHHIYDARFPADPNAAIRPGSATVADYRLLQRRLGTARNVIVQPSTYGIDNRCLLDALQQFGASARGIAVVHPDVSDATLKAMHAAGVRGIRFNLVQSGATSIEMVYPLAKRIEPLGWHIQVNSSEELMQANRATWDKLPVPTVFDHLAHISSPNSEAFRGIQRLLEAGKCWVKLSGAYLDTKVGPPTYADRAPVAKAYIKAAPERLVWGTDWPHPTAPDNKKPDDAILFDLLTAWTPDEKLRHRILVENPANLYGF
jgi:predicted TIM-barrel fold metal-dependent hydrolase